MKKVLLAFAMLTTVQLNAQNVLLNEVFPNEDGTSAEFIELVNPGTSVAGENLDCYSVVTYFYDRTNNTQGFYIIDLPDTVLRSQQVFVLSSTNSFTYSDSLVTTGFNWNTSLSRLELNNAGTAYSSQAVTSDNILISSNGRPRGNNGVYAVALFYNGQVVDVLIGEDNSNQLPSFITNLPDLPAGSLACSSTSSDVSTWDDNTDIVGTVPGNVNGSRGFYRFANMRCGSWLRGNTNFLTPGRRNPGDPSLIINPLFTCGSTTFTFTAFASGDPLNATASLYYDVNNNGILDEADVLITSNPIAALGVPVDIDITANASLLLVITDGNPSGCGNSIQSFICQSGGPTPVSLMNFNAYKRNGHVSLTWETGSESNNKGFEVLRKTDAGYQQIGFIYSAAPSGTSSTGYRYSFDDYSTSRLSGTVYYRLRQVDLNGSARFSDIRALRFNGDIRISIFPNPAVKGQTNVVLPQDEGKMHISLIDFMGRVVKKWDNNLEANLQLKDLRSGAYTLRVVFAETGNIVSERIIVQ